MWIALLIGLSCLHLVHMEGQNGKIANTMTLKTMLDSSIALASKAKDLLQAGYCLSEPKDCEDILRCGQNKSGLYSVWPATRLVNRCLEVFCDMTTDGGGWTVIQRRGDYGRAKDYFYKDWDSYKQGFGDKAQDFWIGNDALFSLTNQKPYSLRFDLRDLAGNRRHATYDSFWIDSEDHNYMLHVTGYTGNAGDSFVDHSGSMFSTKDRDNDIHETSCAGAYKGGWWYKACHISNLNGLFLNGSHASFADGVEWKSWLGYNYSLPFAEMKIRRIFFNNTAAPQQKIPEMKPQQKIPEMTPQ